MLIILSTSAWFCHHFNLFIYCTFSFMCNSYIVSLLLYSLEGHDKWWLHCADASWVSFLLERSSKWKISSGPHHKTSWECRDGLFIETLASIDLSLIHIHWWKQFLVTVKWHIKETNWCKNNHSVNCAQKYSWLVLSNKSWITWMYTDSVMLDDKNLLYENN